MFQDGSTPRIKTVVALYPFKAIESGDLSLEKVRIIFKFYLLTIKQSVSHMFFDFITKRF